jgi:hypothetical protein
MAESIPRCMSAALIQKLHALAERRCAHLIELKMSGRWSHYFTRDEFIARIREAAGLSRHWQEMLETVGAADHEITPLAAHAKSEVPASGVEIAAPARPYVLFLRRPAAVSDRDGTLRRVSAG